MKPFAYSRPGNVEEALRALDAGGRPLAGGTDLLPLLKAGLSAPPALLDIKESGLPSGIGDEGGVLRLGALCTLAGIAESTLLAERHPMLVQAARESATPQIRNRATVGGNLLQRPRCWYFRHPHLHCWLKGGEDCLARNGRNAQHALFGDSPCRAVHPSDLAGCLLALDAQVRLRGSDGDRCIALADFFALPRPQRRRENTLRDNELLVAVEIPARPGEWREIYLKAMDRAAWDFALAGIALSLRLEGARIVDLRVVANGLAPLPWRLPACEEALRGTAGEAAAREAALRALEQGAEVLSENAYKLDLARGLLRQAMEALL